METNHQSKDNDIELVVSLRDAEGSLLDLSQGIVHFKVKDGANHELTGHTGSTPENCYIKEGKMVITAPSGTFLRGQLQYMIKTSTPNEHFKDGLKDVWSSWKLLNIIID